MGGAAGDGQQRGAFTVDTGRALEALRVTWGSSYAVCFDDASELGGERWQAWRSGGHRPRAAGVRDGEERVERRGRGACCTGAQGGQRSGGWSASRGAVRRVFLRDQTGGKSTPPVTKMMTRSRISRAAWLLSRPGISLLTWAI